MGGGIRRKLPQASMTLVGPDEIVREFEREIRQTADKILCQMKRRTEKWRDGRRMARDWGSEENARKMAGGLERSAEDSLSISLFGSIRSSSLIRHLNGGVE